MADVATLRLAIDARAARTGASTFSQATDRIERGASRAVKAVVALAGVTGLGYMVRQQMLAIDATAKLSDRLGMTTESLIGLQHGAKLAGIHQETLNLSLQIFTRTLGEMELGGTAAKSALDQLGLSYKELVVKSPEQAIGVVADAINRLATQSQKAAVAQDLFGRSGQELLTLFAEGSRGIAAYREEAQKLGLAFSRVDAANIEAANNALARARDVITGLFRQATIQLAPYIEELTNLFVNWATAGEGVGHNISRAFELMTVGAIKFGGELGKLGNRWLEMKAGIAEVVALWEKATPAGMLNQLIRERRQIISPQDLAAQYRAQMVDVTDEINAVEEFFAKLRAKAEERAAQYAGLEISPSAMRKIQAMKEYQRPKVGMTDEEKRAVIEQTRDAMESVRHQDYLTRMERLESLKIYQEENAATLEQVAEASRMLDNEIRSIERSRLDAMKVYQKELREDAENTHLYLSERFADVSRTMESAAANAFDRMISEGESFRDAMSGFFRDVGRAFSRMASEMMARAIMLQAMKIMSGGSSPTGAASAAGGFAHGGVFERGRVVPFQHGGVFSSPTYFPLAGGQIGVMGEDGPEAAMPLKWMRSGRLGVEMETPPQVTVQPTPVKVVIVANQKEAALEAMRTDEGQSAMIMTLREHGLI